MPTQLLPVGPPVTVDQNVVYALPAQTCKVTTSAACETSLNGTTWTALTSGTEVGAVFLRSAGVGTVVVCKSVGMSSGTSGGGGATLPTAPLNQVLISQGAGVPPVFSATPKVTRIDAGLASLNATELGLGGVPAMMRDPTNGTLILSGSTTSNADSMIVVREKPLASFYSPSWIGTLGNISDSTVNTPGAVIAGGGSFHVLGRWNGTNWIVVA